MAILAFVVFLLPLAALGLLLTAKVEKRRRGYLPLLYFTIFASIFFYLTLFYFASEADKAQSLLNSLAGEGTNIRLFDGAGAATLNTILKDYRVAVVYFFLLAAAAYLANRFSTRVSHKHDS